MYRKAGPRWAMYTLMEWPQLPQQLGSSVPLLGIAQREELARLEMMLL